MHNGDPAKASYQQGVANLCLHGPILVFETAMATQRISQAMDRIDRALARIETQAALTRHSPAGDTASGSALAARHEALRSSVIATVAQLDALIEGLGK